MKFINLKLSDKAFLLNTYSTFYMFKLLYKIKKKTRGDVLSVFQTPGFFTNLEPDQPGVCTVGRGGGRGKGEGEPIAEPIFSVKI